MGIRVALNHRTHYTYDNPVTLSPHVVRLRPAPHCRTAIESYSLTIRPANHFINWQQDPFGNYQARLVFPEKCTELLVEVDLIANLTVINPFDFFVEEYATHYPFEYAPTNRIELGPYLHIEENGPKLTQWLSQNQPPPEHIIDWMVALNRTLAAQIDYRIRLEPGVQSCERTLELNSGSCRDSGWLLVQILRHCGLAARFVSGYLVQLTADEKPVDGPAGPEADFTDLHAWAEVYIPGAGWVGLDPTSGLFAGEGHIPLSCTPSPVSAAPITGMADDAASEFTYSNTVTRIDETVRITRPYTDADWQAIMALGKEVDRRLQSQDVRLTMGGEPTFVSMDDMEGAEWNFTALSDEKLLLAAQLHRKMRAEFAPAGVTTFAQGKWYPGEPTPRWALIAYWRADGKPLWHDHSRLASPLAAGQASRNDAERLIRAIATWLGVEDDAIRALYEDPLYHVHLESLLPVDVDLATLQLADSQSRRTLANRISQALDQPVGWVLPLRHTGRHWQSTRWQLRRDEVFLMPGDSPAGLRLPLDSLTPSSDEAVELWPADNFKPDQPLPYLSVHAHSHTSETKPVVSALATEFIRSALCVELRSGVLHVFLPPLRNAVHYTELLRVLELTTQETDLSIVIEGYEPPPDSRLRSFRITPDPGVIEVNVYPVASFDELVHQTQTLYALARETRLSAEKFLIDGRHTGTGGGNHVTLGGPTPADSPFLRRPDLLRSLITYWQHHPSLSYLFSGLFIGPTSQAPRIDEARHESLYELEMALSRLPDGETQQPWLVDRLLRNLLIDVTGNTHRTEICIDKLYSPDGPSGRLGLVELRAFEMPPHPRMSIVQSLLLRSLISRFWAHPYRGRLVRWGTALHDKFMLPHFLRADMLDIIDDLREHDLAFGDHWLDAFWEFRFPVFGTRQINDIGLELRAAIEPWHVLGEESSGSGMSRFVDSSIERLQLKVTGLVDERYRITCNGFQLPLRPTGSHGEYVVGVRYRAWQPPFSLHPDLPVDAPLVFDVFDSWKNRSLGGCAYHVAHPGGRSFEDVPVNANVAESRRIARFDPDHHTPAAATTVYTGAAAAVSFREIPASAIAPAPRILPANEEFPNTADLRLMR